MGARPDRGPRGDGAARGRPRRAPAHLPAPRLSRGLLLAALAAAALGSGCSNTTISGPIPDAGAYQLLAVEGVALPATVFDGDVANGESTVRLRVVADSGGLTLLPLGDYEQRVWHSVTVDGVPAPPFTWTDRGTWVAQGGDVVAFVSSLYAGVRFSGTRRHWDLDVPQDLAGEGEVVTYQYRK